MSAKKATKRELLERREWIQELMLKGFKTGEIKAKVCGQHGIAERTVDKDIAEILKSWSQQNQERRAEHRSKALDRLEMLFNIAIQTKNLKSALEVQKEINKIHGLHTQTEAKQDVPKFIDIKKRSELKVVGDGE